MRPGSGSTVRKNAEFVSALIKSMRIRNTNRNLVPIVGCSTWWSDFLRNTVLFRIPNYLALISVLRIRDVYPGSRILIFTHPWSRIPDSKTATKERG